ncbi:MAG: hypothetical protein RL653_883 [Pseudomonadota bacterium]|jgi:hypothetical protein
MNHAFHLLLAALAALAGCAVLRPTAPAPASARTVDAADGGVPAEAGLQLSPSLLDGGAPQAPTAPLDAGQGLAPSGEVQPAESPASGEALRAAAGLDVPGYGEPDQSHVLDVARALVTYRYVRVGRGGSFRMDCSGYVRAAHLSLGLDLFVPRPQDPASRARHVGGVGLILWYNQHHGTYWPRSVPPEQYPVEPRPGDIVYFHDTHDRNKNRRFDDPFTHVGIVEAVDEHGTVTFLHAAGHIVKREKMNLRHPHRGRDDAGNIINHTLRVRKRWEKKGDPHLAAELFAGYGRLQRPGHLPAFAEERAVSVEPSGRPYIKGVRKPGPGKRRHPGTRGAKTAKTSKTGKAGKTGKAPKKTQSSSTRRGNAHAR